MPVSEDAKVNNARLQRSMSNASEHFSPENVNSEIRSSSDLPTTPASLSSLPEELILEICSFLSAWDLWIFSQVCLNIHSILKESQTVWRKAVKRNGTEIPQLLKMPKFGDEIIPNNLSDRQVLKFVKRFGAKNLLKKKNYRHLLHFAACHGHKEVVKFLARDGGVGVVHEELRVHHRGFTPLDLAAHFRQFGVVKVLVEECGADEDKYGESPLLKAALQGNLEMVKYLVKECGLDPDPQSLVCGLTPIHFAACFGKLNCVEFLVRECGASVSNKDGLGDTPLHCASIRNQLNVVQWLVQEAGADVNKGNDWGDTPLHSASTYNAFSVVQFLVDEAGADVNKGNHNGDTPLHSASTCNAFSVVQFLVDEAGADVNKGNAFGDTPLHFACYYNAFSVVQFLVDEAGADVNCMNNVGKTAISSTNDEEIRSFLSNAMKAPQKD